MFCKSCGQTLEPSQTKCRRCGWEVPAISDCGGYYDVVKELNKRGITEPQNPPQVYVTQKAPESKLWVFTAICAVLLVVVMLIQLLLISKVDGLRSVVDEYEPCECTVAQIDDEDDSGKKGTSNNDDSQKGEDNEDSKKSEDNEDSEQSDSTTENGNNFLGFGSGEDDTVSSDAT